MSIVFPPPTVPQMYTPSGGRCRPFSRFAEPKSSCDKADGVCDARTGSYLALAIAIKFEQIVEPISNNRSSQIWILLFQSSVQSLEVRDDFYLVFVDVKVFILDPRLVQILRRERAAAPRRRIYGSRAAGVPLSCKITVFPRAEEVEAWGDGLRQDDEASQALHRHDGA